MAGALRRWWPLLLVIVLAAAAWLLRGSLNDLDRAWTELRTRNEGDVERWQADLRFLQRAMARQHPDLYHSTSEAAFTAARLDLEGRLAELTHQGRIVGVMELVASAAHRRDGHTGVVLFDREVDHGFHGLPIQLWAFSDGVTVLAAPIAHLDTIGMRLTHIGELSVDEVVARLTPLITRDGEMGIVTSAPNLMRVPELLVAIGAAPAIDAVTMTLEGPEGETRTIRPQPLPIDEANRRLRGAPDLPTPLYRSDPERHFWLRYLEDERTLLASPEVDRPGGLAVLIGRLTFSAATNFVTELEKRTGATFVGEPTGGSPNMFGDSDPIVLPHSELRVVVPTRYWEFSTPDDPRTSHEPDLRVALSSLDFFAGRDPVLEAALALGE